MNNGVTFIVDGVYTHSIRDLNLLMLPPKISHPTVKTKTIDIPGSNGVKDLMQYISDIPLYENRKVDITFEILERGIIYEDKVTEVSNLLNGRYAKIIFDETPGYYFYGQCSIPEPLTNSECCGKFSVSVTAEPYKYAVQTIDEPYLWDSFNLKSGVIYSEFLCGDVYNENTVVNVPISTSGTDITVNVIKMPVEPSITVYGDDCELVFKNNTYTLTGTPGGHEAVPIGALMTAGENVLHFKLADGSVNSSVTVSYRDGVF